MRSEVDREIRFSRRALLIGAAQGAIGVLLAGRMAWLSIWEKDRYSLLAEDNRVSIRVIPPRRGWILDRNNKPLALNRPDYRLEMVAEQVGDMEATLDAISRIIPLSPEQRAEIKADIASKPRYMPVEIARGLDWNSFAAINVQLPELNGIQPVRGFSRFYPDGPAVGHLLGYVGKPTREQYLEKNDPLYLHPGFKLGKDGVEKMLDDHLCGTAGARRVEVNARGRILRDLASIDDIPGQNVRLTIDRDLQAYAARRLGDHSASVVVMDCWTGDILCMLSMPAFDPNSFSDGISHSEWQALTQNDHLPLLNKSVQGLYPPGSTFKIITALAILAQGISPDAGVTCTGRYLLGRHSFHCWKRGGHGGVNMLSGIYESCDTYFYHYGRQIGVDNIAAMARIFGLGETFPELPLPIQRKGIVPDQAWKEQRYNKDWLTGETLNAAIGQGYMVQTPLQLAVMTSRIASGLAIRPRLLSGSPRITAPPLDIPPENLAIIRQAMSDVVNSGAGTAGNAKLRIAEVAMAGKTGTAQVRRITMAERRRGVIANEALPWRFRDHALFVAFAPVEAPRYAISIIVEHGSSGSKTAAPIARDILTYLFEPGTANRTLEALEAEWAKDKARQNAMAATAAATDILPNSPTPAAPAQLIPSTPSPAGASVE